MGQIKNIKLHIVTDIKLAGTNKHTHSMAYRHRVRAPLHQARVFMPQWFMKVVRPKNPDREEGDRIRFHVPIDMGKMDIRNYLEKIYNIPVEKVHTEIRRGKMTRTQVGVDMIFKKSADIKIAYVFLKEPHTFHYPEVFSPQSLLEAEQDATGPMGGEGEAQEP